MDGRQTPFVAARMALSALVGFVCSVICYSLAHAFWQAMMVNAGEVPMQFDLITTTGNVHLCDATPEQLLAADRHRSAFCIQEFAAHEVTEAIEQHDL